MIYFERGSMYDTPGSSNGQNQPTKDEKAARLHVVGDPAPGCPQMWIYDIHCIVHPKTLVVKGPSCCIP